MLRHAFVASGLLLLTGLAGCGAKADPPGVATAENRPAAAANASGDPIARYVDAQRKWVACIRQEGYALPDPDAKGFVDLGAFMQQKKITKTDPGFQAAQRKCADLSSEVPAELQPPREPVTAEQLENRRAYARCMRENGAPWFPDPNADGDTPTDRFPQRELNAQEQEGENRASQICSPVEQGKPKGTYDPNKKPAG